MISITSDPDIRGGFLLTAETLVHRPLQEVFPFFADAMNLERLTPPLLKFHVLTPPPIEMHTGQNIDYKLSLHGLPVRWRSEIAEWDPPHKFSDHQLRGPYRYWRHQHLFEETTEGTLCKDIVQYGVPGGALVHWLLVKKDVRAIFEYREHVIRTLFGQAPASQPA